MKYKAIAVVLLTLLFLLFCTTTISNEYENPIEFSLTLDDPISTTLKKDGKKTFIYSSSKNDQIIVDVNQCNIDIAIQFLDKNNKPVYIDRPTGNNSIESFHFEIEANTQFQFEVLSIDPLVNYGYIEVLASSKKEDVFFQKRLQAERHYISGYLKRISNNNANRLSAIDNFKESIRLYQTINDKNGEAEVLFELGIYYNRIEQLSNALTTHFKSLELFRGLGNIQKQARSFSEIAASYHQRNHLSDALYYYQRSLTLWKQLGNAYEISIAYGNIGYLFSQKGQINLAKQFFDLSYNISKPALLSPHFASALQKVGLYYLNDNQALLATNYFEKANDIAKIFGDDIENTYLYSFINLGDSYNQLDDFEKARSWTKKGLSHAKKIGNENIQGVALCTLGNIELNAGNIFEAKQFFSKALELNLNDWRDNALLYLGISQYYESFQKDLSVNQKMNQIQMVIERFQTCRNNAPDSRTMAQSYYWEARAEHTRASLRLTLGKHGSNREFERKLAEAIKILNQGISIIENERNQAEDYRSQVSFFANKLHFYQLKLDMHADQLKITDSRTIKNELFRTAEKIRARTLLDIINQQPSQPEYLPTIEDVRKYYLLQFKMVDHINDDSTLASLEEQLTPLARKIAHFNPETTIEPESIRNVGDIRDAVGDSETLLLSFAFGLEKLYLLALDNDGLKIHQLGRPEAMQKHLDSVRQIMQSNPSTRLSTTTASNHKAMASLAETLLGPLGSISQYKRLVFIPDRFLQLLPFNALPMDPEDPTKGHLVDHFDIAILPSASVWMALRERASKKQQPSKTIAILADPVFNAADRRMAGFDIIKDDRPFYTALPGTQSEAQAIAKLTPNNNFKATGFDASRELVLGPFLQEFRYVHFATHGDIDPENPSQSSLVLSRFDKTGAPIDGTLRLNDIAQLSIRADLVSLSACETATGKIIRGEGLMSLARGFMAAGVPRVLGTLWKVPDNSTSHFMAQFYKGILRDGLAPAQALRQAQIIQKQKEPWRDPHYWAGFVLIGDWQ